jgi:hypothetical protein
MSGRNFFLLTSLPAIGKLGDEPPLGLADFLRHVEEAPKPRAEAEALFLGDDLRQREALLAGEIDEPSPTVLTERQVRDEEPLPILPAAAPGEEGAAGAPLAVDAVWGAYYRRLAEMGRRSAFLAAWVRHEVGLRNALAAARAKALSLDAERYLVEGDLADPEEDFAAVLGEWSAAKTPLAGLRVLDAARWRWLAEHDAWFSFADDELAAYATRLVLLHRWRRIAEAQRDAPAGRPASAGQVPAGEA